MMTQPEHNMSESMHDPTGRPGSPPTVLVVEDHQLLAHGLRSCLSGEGLHAVVSQLGDADSVIGEAAAVGADLVLLDLDLGRTGRATDLIEPLRATGAEVIVLTASRDHAEIAAAVEAGAVASVSKTSSFEELLASVHDAAQQQGRTTTGRRRVNGPGGPPAARRTR